MEKVEERQINLKFHQFYCDECGKFLKEDFEDQEGRYETPGKFLIHLSYGDFFAKNLDYEYKGTFCGDCKTKKYKWLEEQLVKLGFTRV